MSKTKQEVVDQTEKTVKDTQKESPVVTVIATIFSILFLIVALTVTVSVFVSKATGYPQLFGYSLLNVQTDSMTPTILAGDLIVSRTIDEESAVSVQNGDIITFYMIESNSGQRILNTHRVIDSRQITGGPLGYRMIYTTHGDNNPEGYNEEVWSDDIVAIYTGKRVKGMGRVMEFLQQPTGFGLCVLLPIAIYFLYYLIDFVKKFSAYKAEVAAEEAAAAAEAAAKAAKEAELSEEEKRRIAEEYLKQLAGMQKPEAGAEGEKPEA